MNLYKISNIEYYDEGHPIECIVLAETEEDAISLTKQTHKFFERVKDIEVEKININEKAILMTIREAV